MNISTTIRRLLLSVGLPLFLAGNATAQMLPQGSKGPTSVRLLVTCGDLQRDANRWWGSFLQVSINGRSTNLASVADRHCRGVPPDTLLRLPASSGTADVSADPISRTGMRFADLLTEILR